MADTELERALEQVKQQQPLITDQAIEAAKRRFQLPSDLQGQSNKPRQTLRVDRLPQPLQQRSPPPDLGAISAGYAAAYGAGFVAGYRKDSANEFAMGDDIVSAAGRLRALEQIKSGPALLVFVSLRMPAASLERLADQAARSGATLLLRGLMENSLQRTVQRVQNLTQGRPVGFQIDPQAFDRFDVSVVPSFVLVKTDAANAQTTGSAASGHPATASNGAAATCNTRACMASERFALVAGDVSLDYALEHMARSVPQFAPEAQQWLNKLRTPNEGQKP